MNEFIGLTLEAAKELAARKGLEYRLTSVDGHLYIGTQDLKFSRVNFHLVDNIVIKATIG